MSKIVTTENVGTIDLIRALDDRIAKLEAHLKLPTPAMPGETWHPDPPAKVWHPEPPKGH
jgi:hypothetical protein